MTTKMTTNSDDDDVGDDDGYHDDVDSASKYHCLKWDINVSPIV